MVEEWRQQVARRAGVEPDYVDRLVAIGILGSGRGEGHSAADARKVRWVPRLGAGRGAARRDGGGGAERALSLSFLEANAFDRFGGLRSHRLADLSARAGIPLELLGGGPRGTRLCRATTRKMRFARTSFR